MATIVAAQHFLDWEVSPSAGEQIQVISPKDEPSMCLSQLTPLSFKLSVNVAFMHQNAEELSAKCHRQVLDSWGRRVGAQCWKYRSTCSEKDWTTPNAARSRVG